MKTSRKISAGLVLLLLIGLLLIVGANSWKSSLVVKKVVVEGNRIVNTNEILQLAHVEPGMKLYDLDLMVIQRDVVSHHFLQSVLVERDLPATVRITVSERIPIALVPRTDALYLDEEGVVLPPQVSRELFDLPLITGIPGETRMAIGATLNHRDVKEALILLATAKALGKELYHMISEVRLRNGGDLVFYTAEGGIPVLYGRGDAPAKLVRLAAFWSKVVREHGAQDLQYIDLRYEDQVVVRWKSSRSNVSQS